MKLQTVVEALDLTVCAGSGYLDREVGGGYASDLLSDVVANTRPGDIWVTLQAHENTVAVATLRDVAAIILVGGREPGEETIQRAEQEGIPIFSTTKRTFEVIAGLIKAGVPERET